MPKPPAHPPRHPMYGAASSSSPRPMPSPQMPGPGPRRIPGPTTRRQSPPPAHRLTREIDDSFQSPPLTCLLEDGLINSSAFDDPVAPPYSSASARRRPQKLSRWRRFAAPLCFRRTAIVSSVDDLLDGVL